MLKYTNMVIIGEKSQATTIFRKSSRHAWLQTSRRWNVSLPTRIDFESSKASRLQLPFASTFSWGEGGREICPKICNLLLFSLVTSFFLVTCVGSDAYFFCLLFFQVAERTYSSTMVVQKKSVSHSVQYRGTCVMADFTSSFEWSLSVLTVLSIIIRLFLSGWPKVHGLLN